jgi:hypothetical protein
MKTLDTLARSSRPAYRQGDAGARKVQRVAVGKPLADHLIDWKPGACRKEIEEAPPGFEPGMADLQSAG